MTFKGHTENSSRWIFCSGVFPFATVYHSDLNFAASISEILNSVPAQTQCDLLPLLTSIVTPASSHWCRSYKNLDRPSIVDTTDHLQIFLKGHRIPISALADRLKVAVNTKYYLQSLTVHQQDYGQQSQHLPVCQSHLL